MLLALTHEIQYQYDQLVQLSTHTVRLYPAPHNKLPIKAYSLSICPAQHFMNWQYDASGNYVAIIQFPKPTRQLNITVDMIVDKISLNPFDFFINTEASHYPFTYPRVMQKILYPYLDYEFQPLLKEWYEAHTPNTTNTLDYLVEMNLAIRDSLHYQARLAPGIQSPEFTLTCGSGSCRDFAWLQCVLLRQLGFATRFVSGYLMQLVDSDENPHISQDSLEFHAWCEVFLPGAGWIGFDATSGLLAADNHIPLYTTADPSDVMPIVGTVAVCHANFSYHMDLKRCMSVANNIKTPLTAEQWQNIYKVATHVDQTLERNGVFLTMGAEPTFVHKEQSQKLEWQTEALGPSKLELGKAINFDLAHIFAPNGVSLLTQGKWYPGEILPRWAYCSYWRKDGQSLWHNHQWLNQKNPKPVTIHDAEQLLITIAYYLNLSHELIQPVYEDVLYQLWLTGQLGQHFDFKHDILQTHDGQSLARNLYQQHCHDPIGFCLPLNWDPDLHTWVSCQWATFGGKVTALPGETSLGYRLPLSTLATHFKENFPDPPTKSLFDQHDLLPSHHDVMLKVKQQQTQGKVIEKFIRSACCVEIRHGYLYIFIPPIKPLAAYCELLVAIECAVTDLQLPIELEGYPPPLENQLKTFSVTPDPGVIEINIQPASNWQELVAIHENLAKIAAKHELVAYKYLLDGRKVAAGGGCHITLGGPTPETSPFLISPKLLQSMLTFWQHHPSLSYLFSGLFIGPTSQAPRIDEARHEALYELELAFTAMPEGNVENFWLIDRLLRHLLVDVTGNTHRTEFCIDKLFAPNCEHGRQGLVELRAFEMQSDPQLNCLQILLVRTLVTIFTSHHYQHRLHRWGIELHDRFMLPYFIWQDFIQVIEFMRMAGFAFDASWFQPIFEFRFPMIGSVIVQNIRLELRYALEPWPALGEEYQQSQTSRLVDSTLIRLQLLCIGLNPEKYTITCNGIELPLRQTSTPGMYIAGIRFKAWNFTDCLHPNLPALDTLTFDVVDLQCHRSLGGCRYFNQHPGGKNPAEFPINQREAETRQRARFSHFGHTPGKIHIIKPLAISEHYYTLDLRQPFQPSAC